MKSDCSVTKEAAGPPPPTDRARVRRQPDRGRYDRSAVAAILDEGFVCHLGFAVAGSTWVIPTIYARRGAEVYVHGAVGNHALRALADGAEACLTVTLVDGLVLARSAFHHSINYRSVMVFGPTRVVADPAEKAVAFAALVDQVVAGRSAEARPPSPSEIRRTAVLALPLDEASAKVRTGGPVDEPGDLGLEVWAGVVPLQLRAGRPEPEPGCGGRALPAGIAGWVA